MSDAVREAIRRFRDGEIVVVTDDDDRENEGDLVCAASLCTPEKIVEVTGWQPHTVRVALAGALKKRLGLVVASEKVEGRGRVYKIGC